MKKALLVLFVSAIVFALATPEVFACAMCSFYTQDGVRKATCVTGPTGSRSCIPMGADCIQTADCCGCGGGSGSPGGGGGSTCLSRPQYIECLSSNEPRRHHKPEYGIIIWEPQPLDPDGS
ncbi:MAG: hypothetical protein AAB490_01145 [Patescibacteria group bacterium]